MSLGRSSDHDPLQEQDAALRRLLTAALDDVVPPTPDPARARFRRVRPPGELRLRLEILLAELLPIVRRTAVLAGVIVLVGSLALTPAVAHDLGLTGETGDVSGVVTDTAGEPLAGAEVRVLPPSEARVWWHVRQLAARSGTDGRFALAGVPSGLVVVRASAPGSVAQTIADVEIAAGRTTEAAFALAPRSAGAVSGSVRDEQGVALPGALVRLSPRGGRDGTSWSALEAGAFDIVVRADAKGAFRIERVPVGEYIAGASLDGFGADVRSGVSVGPEAERQVDLVLRRLASATLTGSVRASTGAAVAGAEVFFFGRTGERGAAQRSGADGSFSLGVPADEGFLGVIAAGFRSEVSGPYRLQPRTTARVEITLHAAAGPDPGPLAGPRVRFFDGTPAPVPSSASTARPDAPTPTPALRPGSMGGGSWTGGSWGGWRAAATPTPTPRRR